MALKVLLADESTSIKKAFLLALADYAVEVKSVPSGLDVLIVSLDFRPDIIFADVLLTKRSGYDVCKEIKAHSQLKSIPFILMCSHFMEFNTVLATEAGFTDKLEKPFDTEMLRSKINTYVLKTKEHPLYNMIELPEMPSFIESESIVRQKNIYLQDKDKDKDKNKIISDPVEKSVALELADDFEHVQLNQNLIQPSEDIISAKTKKDAEVNPPAAADFEIQIETENFGDFEEVILVKSEKLQNRIHEQIQSYLENSPVALSKSQQQKKQLPHTTYSSKTSAFDESLMREEIRLMAEKICWQIIPDITEKIVREEITKLLSNLDKSI